MDTKNNIPISQIENQAITLGNDDLILVSTKNGDGTYTSKKMKFGDLKTQIPSSTPILENGTVGVIDGTLIKSPATTVTTADALNNVKSYTYDVENDCYLVIRLIQSAPDGKDIKVYVNNSLVCQEYLIDTNDFSEPTTIAFPVKKLSQVEVKLNSEFSANSTLTFFEYKLFSTNPQIGFPDYDHVQVVELPAKTSNDLSFPAPSDGYVSLYIKTTNADDNPTWVLKVNNEIVSRKDCDTTGQELLEVTMLPVRKDDVILITKSSGGSDSSFDSDSFFNFYPITSSGDVVINNIHCGVIDGTYYRKETIDKEIRTGDIYQLYTVQNDCGLYLEGSEYGLKSIKPAGGGAAVERYAAEDKEIHYFLDSEGTLPFYKHTESNTCYEWSGCTTFVKKGTIIYCKIPTGYSDTNNVYTDNATRTYDIRFNIIEYKLHDIRGQVTFPDYNANWTNILHVDNNGDTQQPGSYTVLKDGYICLWCADSSNGGNTNTEWKLSINSKVIFAYYCSSVSPEQSTMYPVSSGDVVSWTRIKTGESGGVTLTFIPIKQKYKEIQNTTTISGGGVIDGTVLHKIRKTVSVIPDVQYVYTTENDCYLMIREAPIDGENQAYDTAYYLDEECTLPIWTHSESYQSRGETWGNLVPLKAGTIIYVRMENYSTVRTSTYIDFIEYKITSTNPQAAFPDWDNNKCIDLLDSNHKNQVHVSSLDDSGYTIDQNGYILYWDAQPTINLDNQGGYTSNLYINNIIVGNSGRAITLDETTHIVDSNQQPTIIPVSKGDVIKLYGTLRQDITGWSETDGRTYCTFYPAKAIEQNGSQTIVGGSGGVIDGTILYDSGTLNKSSLNNYTKIYTVQNDCLLYICVQSNSDDKTVTLSLDQSGSSQLAVFGETQTDHTSHGSRTIPIKKGKEIYAASPQSFNIRFIEYKLVSTAPQIALPDYDAVPLYEVIGSTTAGSWTATDNGFVTIKSENTTAAAAQINGKYIFRCGSPANESVIATSSNAYISKGDILTWGPQDGGRTVLNIIVYKLKCQPQPDCVSYVIESGKFNSLTGQIDSTPSNNNAWYRLYSDGWCEQGGIKTGVETTTDTIVKLYKPYSDANYTITLGNIRDGGYAVYAYSITASQFACGYGQDTSQYVGEKVSWKTEGFVA